MTEITQAKTKFFDTKYPRGHIHLAVLGCHPHYQRHGYGRALCQWALRKAKKIRLPVTVFATAERARLYKHLEFKEPGAFTLKDPEGSGNDIDVAAMYWEPKRFRPI